MINSTLKLFAFFFPKRNNVLSCTATFFRTDQALFQLHYRKENFIFLPNRAYVFCLPCDHSGCCILLSTTTELHPSVPLTCLANRSRQALPRGLPGISPKIHPALYLGLLLSSFPPALLFILHFLSSNNKELPKSLLTSGKKNPSCWLLESDSRNTSQTYSSFT